MNAAELASPASSGRSSQIGASVASVDQLLTSIDHGRCGIGGINDSIIAQYSRNTDTTAAGTDAGNQMHHHVNLWINQKNCKLFSAVHKKIGNKHTRATDKQTDARTHAQAQMKASTFSSFVVMKDEKELTSEAQLTFAPRFRSSSANSTLFRFAAK